MSDTDSFIEEVTEEVRRDRLYALIKKYGWIAILIVLGIVGGTAWREYSAAQDRAQAQAFGDSILVALEAEDEAARRDALAAVQAPSAGGQAVLAMLMAAEDGSAGDDAAAIETLQTVASNGDVPQIYRDIAAFKALTRGTDTLSIQERRTGFEALAVPGRPLRLLAEEQLALLAIESGDKDDALARLSAISEDSEATSGLRRRASQLIVALGGDPAGSNEG